MTPGQETTGPARDPGRTSRVPAVLAAVALAALVLLLPSGYLDSVDAQARLLQCESFLSGSLALRPELVPDVVKQDLAGFGVVKGRDGRLYSKYGPGAPVAWMPFVALSHVAAKVTGLPREMLAGAAASAVNALVTWLTVLSLWLIGRRLGWRRSSRALTVLALLAGTTTLAYANSCWSEPLAGLVLLWLGVLPQTGAPRAVGARAGLLASAAILVRPELILAVPAAALALYRAGRRREIPALFLTSSLGAGLVLAMNVFLRGGSLAPGYRESPIRLPFQGLAGYLVGVDRNLLLFNSALVAAALAWWVVGRRALFATAACVATLWLLLLPFYASWHAWRGGMSFGPRFLSTLLPLSVLPIGELLSALLLRVRERPRAPGAAALLTLTLVSCFASLPLAVAGASVKMHQAYAIADITGRSSVRVQLTLLELKLARGPRGPEVYRKSDFGVPAPQGDVVIDQRRFRTYQWLNHWWALVWAWKSRPAVSI